jgi:KaiC/GvpD/RAD55 family RecA-like ATPase
MSEKHLTSDFLNELFKLCFYKKSILESLQAHFKYEFIPIELKEYKKILKSILNYYALHQKLPTFGIIAQEHMRDADVQQALVNIKASGLVEEDVMLQQLEKFIQEVEFQLMFEKSADLYNNDKQGEAIAYCQKESERIHNFSIKQNTSYFMRVYEDFDKMQKEKALKHDQLQYEKVPLGIFPLDDLMHGGIDVTDTVLWIMRSGIGKSTCLKWTGVYAARLGYDVLHIQLEASEEEAFDKYTQVWSAYDYSSLRLGDIDSESRRKFDNIITQMLARKRDIFIHAFEKFDEASVLDVRTTCLDYKKINGKFPDLILIDSIDLLHPGDGQRYGYDTQGVKMKKENTARKIKNLAVEFKTRVVTVDQADGIAPSIWNDPDQVMTRHNVPGAKGLANSFSFIFTGNQTNDEKAADMMRVGIDKFRNYKNVSPPVKIATAFDYGRFFDKAATIKRFGI